MVEDNVLDIIKDDLDFDFESQDKRLLDAVLAMQNSLAELAEKIDKLEKTVTYQKQVNKNGSPKKKAGRKSCKMYYEGVLIENEDLRHLRYTMQMRTCEILKDFVYINELGQVISDKDSCRKFINNRLRRI